MRINRFIEVLPPSPATLYSIYPERKDDELAETNPDAMRFPPIKLFGYDKAANSLLEKLRSLRAAVWRNFTGGNVGVPV
ncbi:hypothetical protein BANRA_05523 [Klebsiella pneumoniae]|uniref:hypothetical protein n=1 Tax=Klebsiella pneumoniae TaxID=573 RepID=UPI000F14CA92|nr:hypothetical protein [Klebsiella pneumoniae]VCX09567.1 hypothetical protein BANRA_05523 [Klebsiella pneumoniae]